MFVINEMNHGDLEVSERERSETVSRVAVVVHQ
jgi:hypothetical protein